MKYTPEILMGLMWMTKDIVLICACAWLVATLYKASGSWHALWALLMLVFLSSHNFIRD